MHTEDIHFVDTHTHIYAHEFDEDRTEMVSRALAAGVRYMMLPNIDLQSIEGMWRLADEFPGHCFPMAGLHPCHVTEEYKHELNYLAKELGSRTYYGIGETGVDLYWDATTKDRQVDAFTEQIKWGKESGLPVIIHSRESLDLTIDIISRHQDGSLKGIFHCFGGSLDQAMRIRDLGFKIGIGGIVTYKNSGLDTVLPALPADMIVLETDAPYLTPVPYRGKRNEPAYLKLIADKVARVYGISYSDLALLTTRNAWEVFGKKG